MDASLRARLGVTVRALRAKEIESFGLESGQGVVVSWVDPKGPLGTAGLEVGDLILQVNNQTIGDLESLAAVADALSHDQPATFLVADHRSGETANIRVRVR